MCIVCWADEVNPYNRASGFNEDRSRCGWRGLYKTIWLENWSFLLSSCCAIWCTAFFSLKNEFST